MGSIYSCGPLTSYVHAIYTLTVMAVHCIHLTTTNLVYWINMFCQVKVPFIPNCEGPGDASNFDEYREEEIKVSTTERYAKEFADF